MPLYDYKCRCGQVETEYRRIEARDFDKWCPRCGTGMKRILVTPPRVRGDVAGYTCPVTGKWIEGRRAHEENLKRQGCRVLEAGEVEAAVRYREMEDLAFDRRIEETVEREIDAMPSVKKERLANELEAGAAAEVVRI